MKTGFIHIANMNQNSVGLILHISEPKKTALCTKNYLQKTADRLI